MTTRLSSGLLRTLTLWLLYSAFPLHAQDTVHTGTTGAGNLPRLAVADFKPISADPQTPALKRTFDTVLYNDLKNAGIFDMVSKSVTPQLQPGAPKELNLLQWSAAPANAGMLAFGSFDTKAGHVVLTGYVYDVKDAGAAHILAEQFDEDENEPSVRDLAHRFADDIILRLGGGVPGIAQSKIYFVKISGDMKSPTKEIWEMDYDGANAHAITHLGEDSLSPRISPDGDRVAFSTLGRNGWQIHMYSIRLQRLVNFSSPGSGNFSPAWSPDGRQIAYSASPTGDPEIYVSDANGNNAQRLTTFRGPDSSPVWNPRTGSQIAWAHTRNGKAQIYMMDADGSNVQELTQDGNGYAISPSWSPDGHMLAFAWNRRYGPGVPGSQDIYVMDVSTGAFTQVTHDSGRCDFPSWSPDGRHIIYANSPDGKANHTRLMTMLSNGTGHQALTQAGSDMPNWSWK